MSRTIYAVKDENCLDRIKFRIRLGAPLTRALADQYPEKEVSLREFSKLVPHALDLVTVERNGIFKLEGAIGSDELIAYFDSQSSVWPWEAMNELADIVETCGYGKVQYLEGKKPDCANCKMGQIKQCEAWTVQNQTGMNAIETATVCFTDPSARMAS